jgi:hypothetical protein
MSETLGKRDCQAACVPATARAADMFENDADGYESVTPSPFTKMFQNAMARVEWNEIAEELLKPKAE